MTWQDRIRQAAITAPDGRRYEFLYEDLERSRSENASTFKFAERNGAYIQRLSSGQDVYPLTVIFSGPDFDTTGEDFWESTKTPGIFILEHPRFAGLKRVQLLTIGQSIRAKTADNQTAFDCVFHETIEITIPETALDSTSEILNTAEDLNNEASDAFGDNVDLENPLEVPDLQDKGKSFIESMNDTFEAAAAKEAAIKAAFDSQYLSVKSAIENLVEGPLEFANNLAIFVSTPSRLAIDIQERINDYQGLAESTIESLKIAGDETVEALKNKGALSVLGLMSVSSSMCQASVSSASYRTRAEVIGIADQIFDTVESIVDLLESYSVALEDQADPLDRRFEISDALDTLNILASLTTAQLFNVAFTLKQERFIILEKDYSPVVLAHKLYGYSDENLDFLIETNKLRGDMIFNIPAGTRIVYYI